MGGAMETGLDHCRRIADAILHLDADRASAETARAFQAGVDVVSLIEEGISAGMLQVGEKYRADEYHLPELLYAEEVARRSLQAINRAAERAETSGVTREAEERLMELSRSWVGELSSCVTRLFRYDEERKRADP
jgi:methanogenic corrinoid protein MtbC1